MSNSNRYKRIYSSSLRHFSTLIPFIVGSFGAFLVIVSPVALLWLDEGAGMAMVFLGSFFSLGLIPGLYRTGVEVNRKQRRLRQFHGTLGNNKGTWIEVEKDDYLSIVGITQTMAGGRMGASGHRTSTSSKVYLFSGDWHMELFKGDYKDAWQFATDLARVFNMGINDVNKDQNLKSGQSGLGAYSGGAPF